MSDQRPLTSRPARTICRVAERLGRPVERFFHVEGAGGIALLAAALGTLAWANSPWAASHQRLFGPLRFFVDEGLMTVFFFVAGLEIRRELHDGELSDFKRAALPAVAALGGMLAPTLVYLGLNSGGETIHGWGIPTATDIAFAVGVLSLLGRRVPPALRVFLLALAIMDDIGAMVVIAVGYRNTLRPLGMAIAGLGVAVVPLMRHLGLRRPFAYVAPGGSSGSACGAPGCIRRSLASCWGC
jgi:NhaA family Na+:H+ antiporter